jgi:uncharacterized protein YbbK (DUF523 family)/uncharacterized protein YbgA (DUF1722 family)
MVRIGVSACLLGERVRWDGGHKRNAFLIETLAPHVEWVPVCPEVELGLGIPREPLRLEGDVDQPRLVAPGSGTDHTLAMRRLARSRADELARLDLAGYVLKTRSPSCGLERVPVHAGRRRPERRGTGLFARALLDRLPLLPVEEEEGLADADRRQQFLERVLAYARWKEVSAGGMTRARLLEFHAAHELLLLAHDPAASRQLGALVAEAGRRPSRRMLAAYAAVFMQALSQRPTPPRHATVLDRVLRDLSCALSAGERKELASSIAAYRRGRVPLAVPKTLVREHARRLGFFDLLAQAYLNPIESDAGRPP